MASSPKRRDRRKRQTRLTFDPVDSPFKSSPSQLTPAKVRYEHPEKSHTPILPPPNVSTRRAIRPGDKLQPIQVDTTSYRNPPVIPSSQTSQAQQPIVQLSDEDSDPISPLKRRRFEASEEHKDASDEDSDISPHPVKRHRKVLEERDEDGDSDLRTGTPGSDATERYTRQKKTKRHRTEKEKQLEKLRRKRAGEKDPQLTSSESDSDETDVNLVEALSEFEDEEMDDEVVEKPKIKRKKPRQRAVASSDEDDFIVEDDEENIGIPYNAIPLEFTAANNKPEKEHFKDLIAWLVHKKLNPAFNSQDPIYIRAAQRLDQKPAILRSSKYGSSQWTSAFNAALDARPIFQERRLGSGEGFHISGENRCEACNRGNHPTTYAIQFKGKAYDKETLEELQQNNHDDESESSGSGSGSGSKSNKRTSLDGSGRRLPSEEKEWLAGRFCGDKARKAHLLAHWKYHLYEWVLGNLETQGEFKAEQLVKREKMKSWEKQDYADSVVECWEANGELRKLYTDYKNQISELEEAKELGRWGKGD